MKIAKFIKPALGSGVEPASDDVRAWSAIIAFRLAALGFYLALFYGLFKGLVWVVR